ncbi:sperm acrosome-associated protein 5-like [Pantherophis guttatus]|uniref:Sperm acrosome-associated protein 5-like n=1 Tax=Pantherophis guttatus TaxID=94885 RepID=A0ABM3YTK2_PANGU|nr:sperm acrosome-associated protein 5-like [Pantherophis guttatus]
MMMYKMEALPTCLDIICKHCTCTEGRVHTHSHLLTSREGVCMAFYQSGYDTQAVGQQNWDGSYDYGIFQINSSWWCNNYQGHTANGCISLAVCCFLT